MQQVVVVLRKFNFVPEGREGEGGGDSYIFVARAIWAPVFLAFLFRDSSVSTHAVVLL